MGIRGIMAAPVRGVLRRMGYDIVPIPAAPTSGEWSLPEDDVVARNPILSRMFYEGVVEDANGKPVDDVRMSAVQYDDAALLYDVVIKTRPKQTLEIGMAYGFSTLVILEALRECSGEGHTSIDPFQSRDYRGLGVLNVERSGFHDMHTFHEEFSAIVMARMVAEGKKFDLIFIDGDHKFDSIFIDFYFADELLNPGGIIVFHDNDMAASRKVLSFVLRNKPYTLEKGFHRSGKPFMERLRRYLRCMWETPTEPRLWRYYSLDCPHLCVVVRKSGDDHRNWDHYAPF